MGATPVRSRTLLLMCWCVFLLLELTTTAGYSGAVARHYPTAILFSDVSEGLRALSLSSGDLSGDGIQDLVVGFSDGSDGGRIAVYPVPSARIYPQAQAGLIAKNGWPFSGPGWVDLPAAPDWLEVIDVDRDGVPDLVFASQGQSRLFWLKGLGATAFELAVEVELAGVPLFMSVVDVPRSDGWADLVVGLDSPEGPKLVLFTRPGGLFEGSERVALGDLPVGVARVRRGTESRPALVVAAGESLFLLSEIGRRSEGDPVRSTLVASLPSPILSISSGQFDVEEPGEELAVFGENGELQFLSGKDFSPRKTGWALPVRDPLLITGRLAPGAAAPLLILDRERGTARVITDSGPQQNLEWLASGLGRTIAVEAIRLNGDGLDDLVVLRDGAAGLLVIESQGAAEFTVNLEGDDPDFSTGDGRCDIDNDPENGDNCTLRAALTQANATPEMDTIVFSVDQVSIGKALPRIGKPVTIDGLVAAEGRGEERVEIDAASKAFEIFNFDPGSEQSVIRGMVLRTNFGSTIRVAADNVMVEGNYIATDRTGMTAMSIGLNQGISLSGSNSTVGGSAEQARNILANGVEIVSGTGNQVLNNNIGTDVTGLKALTEGLQDCGVTIAGAGNDNIDNGIPKTTDNTIGSLESAKEGGRGNLISGNICGIEVLNAPGNLILGNLIGTEKTGAKRIQPSEGEPAPDKWGNTTYGVHVRFSDRTEISTNVVLASGWDGIFLSGTSGATLALNSVGVSLGSSSDGPDEVPDSGDEPGNGFSGIALQDSHANYLVLNLVGNNRQDGIFLGSSNENGLVHNQIGYVDLAFFFNGPVGNGGAGVAISAGSDNLVLGIPDEVSAPPNIIGFNGSDGVLIRAGGQRNAIIGNAIFGNAGLGINLVSPFGDDGVTPNDAEDEDEGPNGLQNFPVLTAAGPEGISGTLNSKPGSRFQIDLYASSECDPSGHGEGEAHLGSFLPLVTAAGGELSGSGSFTIGTGVVTDESGFVTATATELDPDDSPLSTSEFSTCFESAPPTTLVVNSSSDTGEPSELRGDGECWTGNFISRDGTPEEECTLRAAFQEANALEGLQRVLFNFPQVALHEIAPESPLPILTDPIIIDGYSQPGTERATALQRATLAVALSGQLFNPFDGTVEEELSGIVLGEGSGGSKISGLVVSLFPIQIYIISDGNVVEGNHVGTDFTGTYDPLSDLGPEEMQNFGIVVLGSGNTIGGRGAEFRNVIQGSFGVFIQGSGASENSVLGNYIGTRSDGQRAIDRSRMLQGVGVLDASLNTIGEAGHGNLFMGSSLSAISISSEEAGPDSVGNRILGNRMGPDVVGPNLKEDSSGLGVILNNVVGTVVADNQIFNVTVPPNSDEDHHSNGAPGVAVVGERSKNIRVLRNRIENIEGEAILVQGGTNIMIGGPDPVDGNLILDNTDVFEFDSPYQILVENHEPFPSGVSILSNRIVSGPFVWSSTESLIGLGLDRNPPDFLDRDIGPNGLLNYPLLTRTVSNQSSTRLSFIFSLAKAQDLEDPAAAYRLQVFRSAACGFGGEDLILNEIITGSVKKSQVFEVQPVVPAGSAITATLTDFEGNTSEFSNCKVVETDSDADGSSDLEESLAGGGSGDGNSDGIADDIQAHVLSIQGGAGQHTTFSGGPGVARLSLVNTLDETSPDMETGTGPKVWLDRPAEILISLDQVGATIRVGAANVLVTLFFPPGLQPESYVNFGPTPEKPENHAYEFLFDGTTGAEIFEDRIVLHFVDGQRGDHDLQVNGEILTRGAMAAAARHFFFPQVGDGIAGSIRLQSSVVLANTGGLTPVEMLLQDSTGEFLDVDFELLGRDTRFEFDLMLGSSFTDQSTGIETIRSGYVDLLARLGVGGTAVFSRSVLPSGVLLYEAGVPATEPLTDFTLFVDSLGDRETGVAIAFPLGGEENTDSAQLTLRLYDLEFNLLATKDEELLPGHHLANFITQLFAQVPGIDEMQGTVTVESTQPVVAVTLRQTDSPPLDFPQEVPILTTFPVIPARADLGLAGAAETETVFFPQVGNGVAGDIRLQTEFIFVNPAAGPAGFSLEFFNPQGTPLEILLVGGESNSQFNLNLGAGEALSLETAGLGPLQVGYARITGPAGLGGTAVFRRSAISAQVLLYEAGVPTSAPLSDLSLVVDKRGARDTGVAMVAPPSSPSTAQLTIRLYDTGFNLLGEEMLELAPGAHRAGFVDQFFPGLQDIDDLEGTLTVSSTQPVAAVTIRQNDQPGLEFPDEVPTLATFPVIPGRGDGGPAGGPPGNRR